MRTKTETLPQTKAMSSQFALSKEHEEGCDGLFDLHAEQSLIGSICLFPERTPTYMQVALGTGLQKHHFAYATMAGLFETISTLIEEDLPISPLAIAHHYQGRWPKDCSIYSRISDCTTGAICTDQHISYLCRRLIRNAHLRELRTIGESIMRATIAPRADMVKLASRAIERLNSVMYSDSMQESPYAGAHWLKDRVQK